MDMDTTKKRKRDGTWGLINRTRKTGRMNPTPTEKGLTGQSPDSTKGKEVKDGTAFATVRWFLTVNL